MWQESVSPYLIVELLSPGTEDEDLGKAARAVGKPPHKWEVYEQVLRVPFYVVYDHYENLLRVFVLAGDRYAPVGLTESKFWFEALGLGLGVWQGAYGGVEGRWLRWYGSSGWVATPEERERARAEQAEAALETQRLRAEHLAQRLQELGLEE